MKTFSQIKLAMVQTFMSFFCKQISWIMYIHIYEGKTQRLLDGGVPRQLSLQYVGAYSC
jgi:hypothetical protein